MLTWLGYIDGKCYIYIIMFIISIIIIFIIISIIIINYY